MEYLEHHFPPEMAKAFGVDAAIFCRNIYHWMSKNRANGKHWHDGHWWTYNSQSAFEQIFPYWSRRQLQRIITRCKDAQLLITGDYNEDGRDRTAWYSLTATALPYFTSDPDSWFCNAPNGAMHSTKPCHAQHRLVPPLPDNKPDIFKPPIVPQEGDKPKRASKKTFEPDSKPYICAKYLDEQIRRRIPEKPEASEADKQRWAAEIDKINRLDGYEWDVISKVLQFSQRDRFWQRNILSGAKLRSKFVMLLSHMAEQGQAPCRPARVVEDSEVMII